MKINLYTLSTDSNVPLSYFEVLLEHFHLSSDHQQMIVDVAVDDAADGDGDVADAVVVAAVVAEVYSLNPVVALYFYCCNRLAVFVVEPMVIEPKMTFQLSDLVVLSTVIDHRMAYNHRNHQLVPLVGEYSLEVF